MHEGPSPVCLLSIDVSEGVGVTERGAWVRLLAGDEALSHLEA
jgi:hypothetical protein